MLSKRALNGFKQRVAFWRQNPNRFIVDYLGVKLKFFQEVLVYEMNHKQEFIWVAARGLSKSFTVACFAVAMAILYPGYSVVITSGTKGQAGKVIKAKIKGELMKDYPRIAAEISDIKDGSEPSAEFRNGSIIFSATPNDNARGDRGSLIIADESRLIKPEVISDIFEEMMQTRKFMLIDDDTTGKYDDYKDIEPKVVHMSSAYYKSNHLWSRYKNAYERMLRGENTFAISIPYHLGIKEDIIHPSKIIKRKHDANYDPITFSMESESLFYGEGANAFFKLDMFAKHQTDLQPFPIYEELLDYPEFDDSFDKLLKVLDKQHPKGDGELRLVSLDVAPMSGGVGNDTNALKFFKLIPTKEGYYERRLVNVVSISNLTEEQIAVLIKRWFMMFQGTYFVIDIQGTSLSVFSHLVKPTYDSDTNIEYKAWRLFDATLTTDGKLEEYQAKTIYDDCEDVMYGVAATSALNHSMALGLRSALKNSKNMYKILPSPMEAQGIIARKYKKDGVDPKVAELEMSPYYGTMAMINECIMLESEVKGGFWKLTVAGRNRKDRYSALSYAEHFIKILDEDLQEDTQGEYDFTFRD